MVGKILAESSAQASADISRLEARLESVKPVSRLQTGKENDESGAPWFVRSPSRFWRCPSVPQPPSPELDS